MKIVVFGASGKTGTLLIDQALNLGYFVKAYVRNADSIKIQNPNLEVIVGQLSDKEKLKEAINGVDACISTLGGGSLTKHNPEVIKGIDLIVQVMEELGVSRLLYMSSLGVGESRFTMPQPIRFIVVDLILRVPIADHHANEQRIMRSKLAWTIVRPSGLKDGEKTGNLKYGSEIVKIKGNPSITRANVASFILEQLVNEEFINKGVWLYE